MNLNWEAIAAICKAVGGLAVIASLTYLAGLTHRPLIPIQFDVCLQHCPFLRAPSSEIPRLPVDLGRATAMLREKRQNRFIDCGRVLQVHDV
jgi:hypothetical protein